MSLPVLSVVDVPALPDDAALLIPPPQSKSGAFFTIARTDITWNGNLGLTSIIGSSTSRSHRESRSRYLRPGECANYETFHCAHNGTGGKSNYMRKTAWECRIESKRIEGGCPCFVEPNRKHAADDDPYGAGEQPGKCAQSPMRAPPANTRARAVADNQVVPKAEPPPPRSSCSHFNHPCSSCPRVPLSRSSRTRCFPLPHRSPHTGHSQKPIPIFFLTYSCHM
jgi:hypothetical protein